jgi:hypothetical protein
LYSLSPSVQADPGLSIAGKSVLDYKFSGNNEQVYFDFPVLNASEYTHLHLSVWTASHERITVRLRDFGANGTRDDDGAASDDAVGVASSLLTSTNLTDTPDAWNEVDLNLQDMQNSGLVSRESLGSITIIVFPPGGRVVLDNVFFYNAQGIVCSPYAQQWWLTQNCFQPVSSGCTAGPPGYCR